jgi:cytoskeletal protein CcmA (bactofilin family)
MKIKLTTLILLLALLFVPTASAHAQSPDGGDVFLLGQNYTLASGETLDGSLAVVGGNVMIEEGATVNGDVVVVGGNLKINGDVNGDAAIIGGNLTISAEVDGDIVIVGGQAVLTETAVIDGNVSTIGGQLEKEPGAEITGTITNNAPPVDVPDVPGVPNVPDVPSVPDVPNPPDVSVKPVFDGAFSTLWAIFKVFGTALAVAGIGMLLTLFLQPQLERVADAVIRQPVLAGSFGLLALIVVPVATLVMVVTILLIPVAAILFFVVLPAAWLFGMVALGQEVGERFTKAINQIWSPVLSTGFGTFLLLLVVGFIGLIPCVGWLISFLVTLFALGGVTMTWFGTRSAPGRIIPVSEAAPVEVPPAS